MKTKRFRRKVYTVLHLNAGHDTCGNPRRCYVCIGRDGQINNVVDEGFDGLAALWSEYPELKDNPIYPVVLDTTPAEYRRLCRLYPPCRLRR